MRWLWIAMLSLVVTSADPAAAQDYKKAPPAEELDERADAYVNNRRIVAILLISGTLVGGLISGLSRRRARRREAERSRDEAG